MTNEQLNKKTKVIVVGDIILDLWHSGDANRVSPEAPCLVFNKHSMHFSCGGAANTSQMFQHFPCDVKLFGLADEECLEKIKGHGFNTDDIVLFEGNNPRKIRIVADGTTLLRLDNEKENYGLSDLSEYREKVLEKLLPQIKDASVVILSDYCKGLFDKSFAQRIIKEANKHDVITIADVKKNIDFWTGSMYLKPNWNEAKNLTQETELKLISKSLLKHCSNYVITKSGSGVFFGNKDYDDFYEPKKPPEYIANKSGSGDCFLSILSYYLATGDNLRDACEKAFVAGQVYISHLHNRPVSFYEIKRKIDPHGAKIVTPDELEYLRKKVFPNQKWVFNSGCMDAIHKGHLDSIRRAKSLGDKLIVAINTDESIRRLKGAERPIFPLSDRLFMLAALEDVDFVVPFSEDTPYSLIDKINPSVVCKGTEYQGKQVAGENFTGEIVYLPMLEGYSTTNIIKRIRGN